MNGGSIIKLVLFYALTCASICTSAGAQPSSPPFREIDPRLTGPTDPNHAPLFRLGRLVFRIPNRFLIFPWPNNREPSPSQGHTVFLKIPIRGAPTSEGNPFVISAVTLGYRLGYIFPTYSVEQFEAGPYERDRLVFGTRTRIPKLDTSAYAAFRAAEYIYVKRTEGDSFRLITCTAKNYTADSVDDLDCAARMYLHGERIPQTTNGNSEYTIEFSLPGANIDDVADVGAAITKSILGFLEAGPSGQ